MCERENLRSPVLSDCPISLPLPQKKKTPGKLVFLYF